MSRKLNRADKVAAWRLCMGCGACKWACPNDAISLRDMAEIGIRPFVDESKCENCGECVKVCPGIGLSHESFGNDVLEELKQSWGPIIQVFEGYANDDEIRFAGSSGGIATALALYGLEKENVSGVLHIGVDPDNPLKNIPVFSRNRESVLKCRGSRYAPAAPCQAFGWMKRADGPCIFIGKPCDVAALRKAQKLDPELDNKVALAISIFCAGTPTTQGTVAVLEAMGIQDPDQVGSFRYRGRGWPGCAVARLKGEDKEYSMTYSRAWGAILSKHGQLRCRLCADSTGEFSDIACGDPWYRDIAPNERGHSLVLVRTAKGNEFLGRAINAGFSNLRQVNPEILTQSQGSLMNRRRQLWGRIRTMSIFGVPVPSYTCFSLLSSWSQLGYKEKIKSIIGTLRRIIQRKWRKPEIIK